MPFTMEEEILLCLFDITTRRKLISEIQTLIPDLDVAEMVHIAWQVTSKLEQMSDEAFGNWLVELTQKPSKLASATSNPAAVEMKLGT